MDGGEHVEPKRGSEDVQADSHVRRLFPDLSPEYVDIMSKSIGLAFDRRTFERSAESTYFHARSPQYSTKNGEKLLIKQTISELLEQLREKFSTAEFKAFLDGKKHSFNTAEDKRTKNYGLHSAEMLGKAIETMRQCAATGRGTGFGGIYSRLLMFTFPLNKGIGVKDVKSKGKLTFHRQPFVKAWTASVAVDVIWGTNDYMTTSKFFSYDGIDGPWMLGASVKKSNVICALLYAMAYGFGQGLNINQYSCDALVGSSFFLDYKKDADRVQITYSNDDYDKARVAVEELRKLINSNAAENNAKNRDRLSKLEEMVNKLASDYNTAKEAGEEVEAWINHAKGADEPAKKYVELTRQAEKCCRAFQHICRGTGAVYDGFLRLAMTSYAEVILSKQSRSEADRDDVYEKTVEQSDLRDIDWNDPKRPHMSPFKASKTEIEHRFSQPNPIMVWALKHKYLEIGDPPEVRQLMAGDIPKIWLSLCNLISIVYDRKCALKGFDFAHTLLGFSPAPRRDNIVSDTMYSLFDRVRLGFAKVFKDFGYEMLWTGSTITRLKSIDKVPWRSMTMPQRVPVCIWDNFFTSGYNTEELSITSTPSILDVTGADFEKHYVKYDNEKPYYVASGTIRDEWIDKTILEIDVRLYDMGTATVGNYVTKKMKDSQDLMTRGTIPWKSIVRSSTARTPYKQLSEDYHPKELKTAVQIFNPKSIKLDSKYTIIESVDQSSVKRMDELFD
jgi:hypothetical protein